MDLVKGVYDLYLITRDKEDLVETLTKIVNNICYESKKGAQAPFLLFIKLELVVKIPFKS